MAKHYLIVTEPEPNYFEYEIEHPSSCPKEWVGREPLTQSIVVGGYMAYTCKIETQIDWYGLEDLKDDPRHFKPGKYEIDLYEYYPKSWYEDNDVYLYFVE